MPLLEVLYIKQVQYKFTLHTFYKHSNSSWRSLITFSVALLHPKMWK